MNSSPEPEPLAELYGWLNPVSLLIVRELAKSGQMNLSKLCEALAPVLGLRNPYGTVRRWVEKLELAGIAKSAYEKKQRVVSLRSNYLTDAVLGISECLKFAEALRQSGGMLANSALNFLDELGRFNVPLELYFYGGFARGTARAGRGDVDVVIVVPDGERGITAERVRDIAAITKRMLGGDIHPFVLTRSKLRDLLEKKDPVIARALDGINLRIRGQPRIRQSRAKEIGVSTE
jgi:DNA-binding transcriptional ArsR family regulator